MQLFIVVCFLFHISTVLSCGGDFGGLDFAAAAPHSFNHKTGGGAWNTGANGRSLDVVESLEGGDWACGDRVSFFLYILSTGRGPTCLTSHFTFLGDTTGQSGVAFGDVRNISLNYGNVSNGARPAPNVQPKIYYGQDKAHSVNCPNPVYTDCGFNTGCAQCIGPQYPTLKVDYKYLSGEIFVSKTELKIGITVCNLNQGVSVIARLDVVLFCLPGSKPTGDLQGQLSQSTCFAGGVNDTVSGGAQTVPLKSVSDIIGIKECIKPENFTGVQDYTADVLVSDNRITTTGGAILARFYYSWAKGGFFLQGTTAQYTEMHTYDALCTPNQEGLLQYSNGSCGCEITSITTDQPRFFLYPASEYYVNATPSPITYNGYTLNAYVNKTPGPVLKLYQFPNGTIYQAVLTDGRTFTFSNVSYGPVSTSVFTPPADASSKCTCARPMDVLLLIERTKWVAYDAFPNVRDFCERIAGQFTLGSTTVNMGVAYYDSSYTQALAVSAGTSFTNVNNAINTIGCPNTKPSCGLAATVDVSAVLVSANAALLASPRASYAPRVIILLTTGYNTVNDAVRSTIINLYNNHKTLLISGVYNNQLLYSDIARSLAPFSERYAVELFRDSLMVNTAEQIAIINPLMLQITGLACLASTTPCGTGCCGGCDPTCGKCINPTACNADNGNCSTATTIVNGCCQKVTTGTCEDRSNICMVGTCNATTGLCTYMSKCAASDACKNVSCVNGACVEKSLLVDTFCTEQVCVCNASGCYKQTQSNSPCIASDDCQKTVCNDTLSRCVTTNVPNQYANQINNCNTNKCLPNGGGWTVPLNITQLCISNNTNPCIITTCDVNTGACTSRPKCDLTVTDRCSVPYCDATGQCLVNNTLLTTCMAKANRCHSAYCDRNTGNCAVAPNVTCSKLDCNDYACTNSSGLCEATTTRQCTCTCQNNQCFTSSCDANNICQNEFTPTQCPTPVDKCKIPDRCDNQTGCLVKDVVCRLPNACEILVRDSTVDGCCVYTPKNCTESSPCYNYTCDNTTGCIRTYKCEASTNCTTWTCDLTQGCMSAPVPCPARSKCETAECVEGVEGGCVYTPLTCDDGIKCTKDECHPDTGCSNPLVDCGSDKCYRCQELTGLCVSDACDDGINCTIDTCNNGTCQNVPNNETCGDGDRYCKTWRCETDPTKQVGCVPELVTCPNTDNCTTPFCKENQGCIVAVKACNVSSNNTACATAQCEQQHGDCVTTEQPCAVIDTTTVVAASLGAAAVVGIAVAVVACIGLSAGGTWAAYNKLADDGLGDVHNNPLFMDPAKGGENPLAQMG